MMLIAGFFAKKLRVLNALRTGCLFAVLTALGACEEAQTFTPKSEPSTQSEIPIGTGFDFYVMAFSWSPGYCRSQGERANRQQCGGDERYGFVVHGLWPQFSDGYPQDCATDLPLTVERSIARSMLDIMPSYGLINHEWAKHGTCSGLSQSDYFKVTRAAYDRINKAVVADAQNRTIEMTQGAVEAAFRQLNAGLDSDEIAVTCDRRFLRDVRVCLSKDLSEFVSCPQVDRNFCRLPQVVVPPIGSN